jgi:hypothetical protein
MKNDHKALIGLLVGAIALFATAAAFADGKFVILKTTGVRTGDQLTVVKSESYTPACGLTYGYKVSKGSSLFDISSSTPLVVGSTITLTNSYRTQCTFILGFDFSGN